MQRVLSAKNVSHAKGGCIVAAYIKFLPLFVMVIPGMISRILWPGEHILKNIQFVNYYLLIIFLLDVIACSDPKICFEKCGRRSGCTNYAYPMLVMRVMPAGNLFCYCFDVDNKLCSYV